MFETGFGSVVLDLRSLSLIWRFVCFERRASDFLLSMLKCKVLHGSRPSV
jgi:hypothetical protein